MYSFLIDNSITSIEVYHIEHKKFKISIDLTDWPSGFSFENKKNISSYVLFMNTIFALSPIRLKINIIKFLTITNHLRKD